MVTETAVKAVKPVEKAREIYDERGLFLFVPRTGARLWRMKYKVGGREKLLALGEWPHTSLKRARERRDEVRRLLADGIDPAAKKKAERQAIDQRRIAPYRIQPRTAHRPRLSFDCVDTAQ